VVRFGGVLVILAPRPSLLLFSFSLTLTFRLSGVCSTLSESDSPLSRRSRLSASRPPRANGQQAVHARLRDITTRITTCHHLMLRATLRAQTGIAEPIVLRQGRPLAHEGVKPRRTLRLTSRAVPSMPSIDLQPWRRHPSPPRRKRATQPRRLSATWRRASRWLLIY
jgi:hypothetical protein